MAKKIPSYFGLRMTPDEIASIEKSAKAAGTTRSAWARSRLLTSESSETDTAAVRNLAAEIARQHEQTRKLILEKNINLAGAVGRDMRAELFTLGVVVKTALDTVAVAVKNAGERSAGK